MTTRARLGACGALAMALSASTAVAHVGSSPQTNNRYITLVPEPGAVRMVYTIIFGESPGAAARKRIDRDGDGHLSADEQGAFGDSIADVIAAGLDIELDGEPVDVAWRRVDVGIGSTSVDGGALSVDLAAVLCTGGGGEHSMVVRDGFRVPPVGEGALAIEPSGVQVARSAMGQGQGTRRAFKWIGRGTIADEGYALAIREPEGAAGPPECDESSAEATERAAGAPGAEPEPAAQRRGGPGRGAVGAVALIALVALMVAARALRRRR